MTIAPRSRAARVRRPTTTAAFGSGRRESHDASGFYGRFVAPEVSAEDTVGVTSRLDVVHRGDARDMGVVATNSVALVVTSPPYFAGKEYEESLGTNGVPATYFEYLGLLRDVFAECKRVLEPGGRIGVNVANLGRRPYRSLAGDVADILQDLGLLLRGEVVWWKGRAAGGSCAWGTFQRPSNPVLRDVTERIVIASKGRFDRALTPQRRAELGLPSVATISRDEFLEATTDLWELPPERATRVGHPAPFPVELPGRLIDLFTYEGDVVLDPFMGSGTTAVAAIRSGRHFIGFDTDAGYVARSKERIKQETQQRRRQGPEPGVHLAPAPAPAPACPDRFSQGLRDGLQAKELATLLLESCGFSGVRTDVKLSGPALEAHLAATDSAGTEWLFEVAGSLTAGRSGLRRSDTLWRSLGRVAVLAQLRPQSPIVILTTDCPSPSSGPARALAALTGRGRPVLDVVELLDPAGHERLRGYAGGRERADMASDRTFVTEVATGLGMLGDDDLDAVLARRPAAFSALDRAEWERLADLWHRHQFGSEFVSGFLNGRAFLKAPDGLNGRIPRIVEWTGGRRPPGDEVVPSDLRVDHVYLVSCKYLSRILHNPSPARLVEGLLSHAPIDDATDWYERVAPSEYQDLYEACAGGDPGLPGRAADLATQERRLLAARLAGGWPVGAAAAYQRLCSAVATRTAEAWSCAVKRVNPEAVVWRLLRIGSAPYFVLGSSRSGPMRLRIDTPWDWRQRFRLRRLDIAPEAGGQPRVSWTVAYESCGSGEERFVRGHVEIRWSHGRFAQPPEAKVYLDTRHEDVPGYHRLEPPVAFPPG